MSILATAFFSIGLAELGDKTQLLTILLVMRMRKVWPVIFGIFIAIVISQLLASILGFIAATFLTGRIIHYAIAFSFILGAILCLIPEKSEDQKIYDHKLGQHFTIIANAALTFIIAELGDKTQLLTAALAARYHNIIAVTLGSILGMMAVNIPAAFIGHKFSRFIPMKLVKYAAALVFFLLGIFTLISS